MSYVIEGIMIPIMLYYLIVNVVKTSAQLRRMLVAMLFFCVIEGAYHLYRIYEATGFSAEALKSEWWAVTVSPLASDITGGVQVLVILLPVALVLCSAKEQRPWLRFWAFLAMVFCCSTILFSFLRGAWLAVAVEIVLLAIFSRRVRFFALALAPLVIFLGWLFGGGELLAGILEMRPLAFLGIGSLDESILCRFYTWGESVNLMIDHPLTGIGLGTFPSALIVYHGVTHPELWMQSAHQLFLGVGAEAGIIALLLFIAIFLLILKEGVSLMRSLEDAYPKNLILGLVVGVVGYIVVGLSYGTDPSYKHFILPTLILWAVIGLIMAYRNYSHHQA